MTLMKIHSRDNDIRLSEAEWAQLADSTEGYSGSDLATLVLGSLFEPIRDLQNSKYWTLSSKPIICNPKIILLDKNKFKEKTEQWFLFPLETYYSNVLCEYTTYFKYLEESFRKLGNMDFVIY